jgi:hypothetical protein
MVRVAEEQCRRRSVIGSVEVILVHAQQPGIMVRNNFSQAILGYFVMDIWTDTKGIPAIIVDRNEGLLTLIEQADHDCRESEQRANFDDGPRSVGTADQFAQQAAFIYR